MLYLHLVYLRGVCIESARGAGAVRKKLQLVKPGERGEAVSKETHRAEPVGDDLLWMTVPLDEKSSAWIMEYTWTPSQPAEPAARPKLRRRK